MREYPTDQPHQWQRWNSRSILLMKYFLDPLKHTEHPYGTLCYCRPLRSFIHQGVRMYVVRACNSIDGKMNGPMYTIPFNMLERTRMKRIKAIKKKDYMV